MQNLLPHYERELGLLRQSTTAFARQYPKIAGRLQLSGDVSQDPHVERMIESFALLAARIHKRLDDDFPLVTESLLNVLYPHYLKPIPACSIAHFELGAAASQMGKPAAIERGTKLTSRPVKGVPCQFRTTQNVLLHPVKVVEAQYRNAVAAPDGTRLPAGATSVLSLTLELLSPQATWHAMFAGRLRFYLDGEASQVSVLREALVNKVLDIMVQVQPHQAWRSTETLGLPQRLRPSMVGFADDESLLDFDARSNQAYRLLTEYFAFPEKFNFIDIPVPEVAALRVHASAGEGDQIGAGRRITLHLVMAQVRSDSDESRLLEMVGVNQFVLGCSPVINLFDQPADPIRVTQESVSYPVVVDGRRAYGYDVYGVKQVFRVRKTPHGDDVQAFLPFFSIQHDAVSSASAGLHQEPATTGRYFHIQRNEVLAEQSPGHETEMSIVDLDFNPADPQAEFLSLNVTATNRDLPSLLPFGSLGGDLFMEGGGLAREIKLLRKPTLSQRFVCGPGTLWRLISHLSLNHLSLASAGIDGLKEILRLYDLPSSATSHRQIDGLKSVVFKPATAWLPGEPFANFVRGTEICLTLDEDAFVGSGLGLFVAVLDHFLGVSVHVNSFTKLTVLSSRTQEVVLSCPPRNGAMKLV